MFCNTLYHLSLQQSNYSRYLGKHLKRILIYITHFNDVEIFTDYQYGEWHYQFITYGGFHFSIGIITTETVYHGIGL